MKTKQIIFYVIGIMIISTISSFFIDIKLTITITLSFFLLLSYISYKEKIGKEFIIAILFALFITSYYLYEYTTANLYLGKINLFPLVAWTAGLVILREFYESIKIKNKFLLISLIYIGGLFILEYMGFYIFKIRLNSDFPSLLRLGIIHASLGMKLFYIFAGPLYIFITDYLKVK